MQINGRTFTLSVIDEDGSRTSRIRPGNVEWMTRGTTPVDQYQFTHGDERAHYAVSQFVDTAKHNALVAELPAGSTSISSRGLTPGSIVVDLVGPDPTGWERSLERLVGHANGTGPVDAILQGLKALHFPG